MEEDADVDVTPFGPRGNLRNPSYPGPTMEVEELCPTQMPRWQPMAKPWPNTPRKWLSTPRPLEDKKGHELVALNVATMAPAKAATVMVIITRIRMIRMSQPNIGSVLEAFKVRNSSA
jgi:hypothetical protein